LLFDKVKNELIRNKNKVDFDLELVLYLIEKTIFNNFFHIVSKYCISLFR
jgi:hypothetical protein